MVPIETVQKTRQRVVVIRHLRAPADAVWARVSDWRNVRRIAPMIDRVECEDGAPAVGSMRICHFDAKHRLRARVTQWTDGVGFTTEWLEAPLAIREPRFRVRVSPLGVDRCEVRLELSYPLRPGLLGRLYDVVVVQTAVYRAFDRILEQLEILGSKSAKLLPIETVAVD